MFSLKKENYPHKYKIDVQKKKQQKNNIYRTKFFSFLRTLFCRQLGSNKFFLNHKSLKNVVDDQIILGLNNSKNGNNPDTKKVKKKKNSIN